MINLYAVIFKLMVFEPPPELKPHMAVMTMTVSEPPLNPCMLTSKVESHDHMTYSRTRSLSDTIQIIMVDMHFQIRQKAKARLWTNW